VIPRGGEHLIQTIKAKSQIPVIKNDRGLCHVYVHQQADLSMAARIVENAKLSRPSVCNAMETLLVDKSVVKDFVPLFFQLIKNKKITLHADSFIKAEIDSQLQKQNVILDKNQIKCVLANQKDYQTEYLSAEMNIKSVVGLQEAIEHIQLYSSKHSESIVTQDEHVARQFQSQVDAACVYWNASTRFTDGMEFGLGGEIGISTDKLHVRGPVGVESLTTGKWVIDGQGQIRT
jgi:glutamate-5-semialdehyde dehydrogenase